MQYIDGCSLAAIRKTVKRLHQNDVFRLGFL